ncbi:MAG TPA: ABC transporter permease subunit [Epulopiscium sp.]|nr:ABC transporter permease subunit [Candidatus Epulonipiscium sp.]
MKGFTLNKYKVLGLIMIIIVWELSHTMIGNSVVLPSVRETTIAFKEIITSLNFGITIATTLNRIVVSFLIGLILALILGILSALNKWFYDFLSPVLSLFKIVPTMAIVILALIWLTNQRAPVLIAVIIVLPILYEAVIKGIKNIDKNILNMTTVYKVSTVDIIRYIYIPSILNNIMAIFSSSIGLCLKIVIGGEVLGQPQNSIGTSIQTEKMYLNTAGVLGWIVILVILSLVIDIMAKTFVELIKVIRKGLKDGKIRY